MKAHVTATFRTSLEVKVVIEGEEPRRSEIWPCVTAFLTFVAIDESGKSVAVPQILLESDEQHAHLKDAEERRSQRLKRRT